MTISATQIAAHRTTTVEQLAPLLNEARPVLGVMDFNILDQLIEQLREAYSAEWIFHTVAVETIGLPGILEHFRARGLGAATASASELDIAKHTGFVPHELIHRAPVNTWAVLGQVLDAGLDCSVDNFAELSRLDKLIDDPEQVHAHIGLMITPQAPVDDADPVQTPRGIGLRDHREEILEAHMDRAWLTQLHINFATPPESLQQAAEHVAAIYQLAEDIEHASGGQRIQRIHISGALPAPAAAEEADTTMANHRFVHQAMVPELFDGKYTIVTEFTQALTATAGMLLARVEYTKDLDRKLLAVVHADATFADPATVRIEAYDAEGQYKDDIDLFYYDVVGPSGLIAHQVPLPDLEEGDVLTILDVGATAFGSRNVSTAPVYGIRADGLLTETALLHAGQTAQELAKTAGVYQPVKRLH